MKTLYLPLKKEWYEMIESSRKTEEYREIKPYWCRRIMNKSWAECPNRISYGFPPLSSFPEFMCKCTGTACISPNADAISYIRFSCGYTKRTMLFECKGITIGKGKPEWGAPENEEVFIIKLGKRL